MLRRFALFLAVLLVACGGPAPAPKGPELKVGQGKGDAPIAVSPPDTRDASEAEARVPVFSDDPVRGSRDAYVTLVLFSDFQCPFCSRFEPTLERAREEFGDNLRIVWKNQPLVFHQYAKTAALVGYGVFATKGPEAFWQFHDMAFRRQQLMSEETIKQWGLASGLTQADLDVGLAPGSPWQQKIERDIQLANKIGAQGTPMSYVNGTLLSGAQPYEKVKETIDAELAKAKALEARGTPRGKIYKLATAENYKEPSQRHDDDDEDEKPDTTVWKVPVGTSPVRGQATALVTIIEFSDFQCPYCKRVEPTLDQVRKQYGSKVRIVWKDEPLPFHPRAVPAANLAREARQQKGDTAFWDVHDKLFASQPKLEDEDLEAVAKAAGLDAKKAMHAVTTQAHKKGIDADMDLGDDVQASGTPHFFVNGRRLVGAQPFDKFKTVIDEEMTKAEALVRAGTPANAVYETITKNGRAAPELETKTVKANPSAPFRGPANAPVVIQEFSDFQCPFCGRVEGTLDQITKDFPQKVKLVWRDLPLPMHPDAPLAAEAAREAFAQKGNAGFQAMRELLFKNQSGGLKRGDLEGYAVKIGLDLTKFNKALDDHKHKAAVDADADAAHAAGISGTPAFLVGPYFISGAQPYPKFKKAIERVLAGPPPSPPPTVAGPTATTPSGLQISDLSVGTGPAVKTGDKVSVHYVGTLKDGTEFDSSRKHGQPFGFTVGGGQVIKGWDQGLVGMKVGGKRKLVIPPDLAYGDKGMPPVIPAKSTLTFEIELLSIK